MLELVFTVLSTFWPQSDAVAFKHTAPGYLTTEQAKQHLAASYIASKRSGIDQDLLLSVAFYESRYTMRTVTQEPQGKISCGVMTPVPTYNKSTCRRTNASLVNGYEAGAGHLKDWFRMCKGSRRCALLGYAGGYALLNACKRGPYYKMKGTKRVDICKTHQVRLGRANTIRRTRISS